MIPVNEVRVGNAVMIYGNIATVVPNDFAKWIKTPGRFDDFEPIPLTPEILKKAGFVFYKNAIWNYTKKFSGLDDPFMEGGVDVSFEFRLIDGVLVPDQHYTAGHMLKKAEPRYLHQLQNWFYSQTFEELEVNL